MAAGGNIRFEVEEAGTELVGVDRVKVTGRKSKPAETVCRDYRWRFDAEPDSDGLTLVGHAAVFNQWTEIHDHAGRYMESIAPGAFRKTLKERGHRVLLLLEHGKHPVVGMLPIGVIEQLREDDTGLFVQARLHDNWMTKPVRDAIASRAMQDMSFQFRPISHRVDPPSEPGGLERVTHTEVALFEVGPCAFGAYSGTDVGLRAWAETAPVQLRDALFAVHGGMVNADCTPEPAASRTGSSPGAAEGLEPAIEVTRQMRRRMAAVLRGLTDDGDSPGAAAAAA